MKNRNCSRQNKKSRKEKSAPVELSGTSINDLPEAILVNILSFLPTTAAAVKTSVVAPAWCNLWQSVPNVHFDMFDFHSRIPEKSNNDARQLFAESVSQTLLHRPRHFPLRTFKLIFYYRDYETIRSYVNSWVRFVVTSKAVELDLYFVTSGHDSIIHQEEEEDEEDDDDVIFGSYKFHLSNLKNSSIEVLKLRSCDLHWPSNALSMKFDCIREIHLEEFCCTDEEIEHLVVSCVNLETLSLDDGWLLHKLKLVSPKLKHFKLHSLNEFQSEGASVEICAPNLESIELSYFLAEEYALKCSSSLVTANVHFLSRTWKEFVCWTNVLSSLSGVQWLTIQNMWTSILEESIDEDSGDIEKKPEEECYENPLNIGDESHGNVFIYPFLLEQGLIIFLSNCIYT